MRGTCIYKKGSRPTPARVIYLSTAWLQAPTIIRSADLRAFFVETGKGVKNGDGCRLTQFWQGNGVNSEAIEWRKGLLTGLPNDRFTPFLGKGVKNGDGSRLTQFWQGNGANLEESG